MVKSFLKGNIYIILLLVVFCFNFLAIMKGLIN
jgi:hypothetical protein